MSEFKSFHGDNLRYPNRRYGNPAEMAHYAKACSDVKTLARSLRRDERTTKDWLNGKKKVPFWVPELLRLRHMEARDINRQMGIYGSQGVMNFSSDARAISTDLPITMLHDNDFSI